MKRSRNFEDSTRLAPLRCARPLRVIGEVSDMTLTDDEITRLWNEKPVSKDFVGDFARAIIAAHDAAQAKQEPVAWIHPNIDYRLVSLVRWSDDCLPLYAAPIPPEGSKP